MNAARVSRAEDGGGGVFGEDIDRTRGREEGGQTVMLMA